MIAPNKILRVPELSGGSKPKMLSSIRPRNKLTYLFLGLVVLLLAPADASQRSRYESTRRSHRDNVPIRRSAYQAEVHAGKVAKAKWRKDAENLWSANTTWTCIEPRCPEPVRNLGDKCPTHNDQHQPTITCSNSFCQNTAIYKDDMCRACYRVSKRKTTKTCSNCSSTMIYKNGMCRSCYRDSKRKTNVTKQCKECDGYFKTLYMDGMCEDCYNKSHSPTCSEQGCHTPVETQGLKCQQHRTPTCNFWSCSKTVKRWGDKCPEHSKKFTPKPYKCLNYYTKCRNKVKTRDTLCSSCSSNPSPNPEPEPLPDNTRECKERHCQNPVPFENTYYCNGCKCTTPSCEYSRVRGTKLCRGCTSKYNPAPGPVEPNPKPTKKYHCSNFRICRNEVAMWKLNEGGLCDDCFHSSKFGGGYKRPTNPTPTHYSGNSRSNNRRSRGPQGMASLNNGGYATINQRFSANAAGRNIGGRGPFKNFGSGGRILRSYGRRLTEDSVTPSERFLHRRRLASHRDSPVLRQLMDEIEQVKQN
jgi:hypothetical protein